MADYPSIPYEKPFGARLEVVKFEPDVGLPTKAYRMSAAYDLAAFTGTSTLTIAPQTTKMIRTGLGLLAPVGHCILICSRSGLGAKSVFVANAPGVVDPDYTGEIKVLLYNGGMSPFYVRNQDRIAQALIVPFGTFPMIEVKTMPQTERGEKGFGSSGS